MGKSLGGISLGGKSPACRNLGVKIGGARYLGGKSPGGNNSTAIFAIFAMFAIFAF